MEHTVRPIFRCLGLDFWVSEVEDQIHLILFSFSNNILKCFFIFFLFHFTLFYRIIYEMKFFVVSVQV